MTEGNNNKKHFQGTHSKAGNNDVLPVTTQKQQEELEWKIMEENQEKDSDPSSSSSSLTIADLFMIVSKLPIPLITWLSMIFMAQIVLPFFILYDWLSILSIICAVVQMIVGVPLLLYIQGLSKLLAIAHLFGMPIVVVYGIMRLSGAAHPQITSNDDIKLFIISILMVTINGISLILDFTDIYRYFVLGNRDVYTTTGLIRRNINNNEQNNNEDKQNDFNKNEIIIDP